MTGPIRTRIEGHILEVILDRPKANAVDLATSRAMGEVFRDFRDNPDLRVAILTGAGEKFFCPGWDLKAAADGDAVDGDYGVGGFGGLQELPHLNKPVICAVNGICCGGGLEIALSCDIILAAEHATFALPEIRSGTVADAASVKLPKRIPYHVAMEMLFTGRWLEAEEAQRWGMINHIHKADELMDKAWEMARLLESGPPPGLRVDQGDRPGSRRRQVPGHDEPDHPPPVAHRRYALRVGGQSGRRARVCRETRSGLEGQIVPACRPPIQAAPGNPERAGRSAAHPREA